MGKIREIIREEIERVFREAHDLSGAPEEFEVPDVNPNAQKFKEPNQIGMDRSFLDTGPEGYVADKNTKTASANVLMDIEDAKNLPGEMGENRHWHKKRGEWWFGNYPLHSDDIPSWQEFVNDIAENGLDWPITITVEKNGDVYLREGNHRLAVYDLLGIKKIPANIWWWGNVQGTDRDPMKKYYYKVFGKDEAIRLDESFQPRSSLQNFRRSRGGIMQGILSKQFGNTGPSTPMEQKGGWNPPDIDQYQAKFTLETSKNFQRGYSNLNEGDIKNDGSPTLTAEAHVLMETSDAINSVDESIGSLMWHLEDEGWYFGDFPLYEDDGTSWNDVITELIENGPNEPIKLEVWADGDVHLIENAEYGIGAYDMLNIPQIPVHIQWYGDVQGSEKDSLKEYHRKVFTPRNANNLQQYFDNVDGAHFVSGRKRTNWVDDNWDGPVSPAGAYQNGDYLEGSI